MAHSRCLLRSSHPPFPWLPVQATPYALLLFGGPLVLDVQAGTLAVQAHVEGTGTTRQGGESAASEGAPWVRFKAIPRIGVLMGALRKRMDELLTLKIQEPETKIQDDPAVLATIRLLVTEGLG